MPRNDGFETALDELFAAVPEEFVATRDRIAHDLKAGGEKDLAAQVKAMKRPTLATWSLNRLGHDDIAAVDEYLDASSALRRVQENGGARDDLLAAMRAHRDAQQELADRAVAHAASRPGDPERVRGAVQDTLEAAALDDGIAGALRGGRLTSTERAVSAFEVLDVQPLARSAPKPRSTRPTKSKTTTKAAPIRRPTVDRARVARARSALTDAEQATAAAKAALAEAEQRERDAREELRRAQEPR